MGTGSHGTKYKIRVWCLFWWGFFSNKTMSLMYKNDLKIASLSYIEDKTVVVAAVSDIQIKINIYEIF